MNYEGWKGELNTSKEQKLYLDPQQYHIFNNITIRTLSGSSQIDHVIVSKYGLFVIETKNFSGWIFGDIDNDRWTQVLHRNKHRYHFLNPILQNSLHVSRIVEFLTIDRLKVHSIVVFWGNCEFKTDLPRNVIKWENYTTYVKLKRKILLTDDEVNNICMKLQALKNELKTLNNKKEPKSPPTCPKCGGNLIIHTFDKGKRVGEKYLRCSNYPKCLFGKEFTHYSKADGDKPS